MVVSPFSYTLCNCKVNVKQGQWDLLNWVKGREFGALAYSQVGCFVIFFGNVTYDFE